MAQGFRKDPPACMTYASAVGRDSIRLGFLIAVNNDLQVLAGDIQNAFLNAPCSKKVYIIAGPEWGPLQNRIVVIEKTLYGLKSSGAAWRQHLADHLTSMGF